MSSIVEAAVGVALDVLKDTSGETVVYYTDASHSVAVKAIVGRTRIEAAGQDGFTVQTSHRNYLIDAADLKIAGDAVTPDAGHYIVHAGRRFEVQPEIPGQKPWRWSDRGFRRYRIDTREVKNA